MVSRIGSGSTPQPVQSSYDSASIETERPVTEVQPIKDTRQQPPPEERKELSKSDAKQLTDGMNKFLESVNTQLRFKFHDKLNEYYVTIVDSQTDEIVREIPPKKLMDMYASMKEFVGLLVDRKI
ncbi:flagellar protein FlaG [Mammaliicoccus sciuri]|uniref:Flagellar protein FlaG n=1 Tax=Sporosarcina newyorkensis TaxID=759851 RepID=A0A1T4Y2B6_9BACL|nr:MULTISPECIES: flagellar protein FlaG [Sporosarcina]MBY0221746.1 flagellar protein FlaG [Sporosarcina aquimarina]SKA95939.1 flagellar protein FlaG [Sporosarcina newyorkensis]